MRPRGLLRILGTIVIYGIAITAPSAADISVDVSPAKYELTTQPGKQETFPITVRNTSTAAVHIVATLSDYIVGPTGNYAFAAPGKSPRNICSICIPRKDRNWPPSISIVPAIPRSPKSMPSNFQPSRS